VAAAVTVALRHKIMSKHAISLYKKAFLT